MPQHSLSRMFLSFLVTACSSAAFSSSSSSSSSLLEKGGDIDFAQALERLSMPPLTPGHEGGGSRIIVQIEASANSRWNTAVGKQLRCWSAQQRSCLEIAEEESGDER